MIINIDIDTETGNPVGYLNAYEYARLHNVTRQVITAHVVNGNLEGLKIGHNIFIKEGTPYPGDKRTHRPPVKVKAINTKTGEEEVFRSMKDAAVALNVSVGNISHVVKGHLKHTGGYKFVAV